MEITKYNLYTVCIFILYLYSYIILGVTDHWSVKFAYNNYYL